MNHVVVVVVVVVVLFACFCLVFVFFFMNLQTPSHCLLKWIGFKLIKGVFNFERPLFELVRYANIYFVVFVPAGKQRDVLVFSSGR